MNNKSENRIIYRKKLLKNIAIDLTVGALIYIGMLLYSEDYTFVGMMDALAVAGVLVFTIGWMFFVFNEGIFDLTTYGVVAFAKAFTNKKKTKTFEEYCNGRSRVEKPIYHGLWIAGALILLASLALYFYYYNIY